MNQVECLGQGVAHLFVLRGILTEINLGLAVAGIAVILAALLEIVTLLVVVLVKDGQVDFLGQFPSVVIVGIAGMRTGTSRTYNHNLGMCLLHLPVHILETLGKLRRNLLLIADAEILQSEGFGVSLVGTHLAPFGGHVAVGPLNQVESVLHPLIHLVHRHHLLGLLGPHAPAAVGSLTAHTTGQDGHGFHLHVLAQLEILIVAQSHRLVVAPGVLHLLALLLGAEGGLPPVCVPETVTTAMHHATAGEAQELGMQRLQCFGQVAAQSMTLIGVLGHER